MGDFDPTRSPPVVTAEPLPPDTGKAFDHLRDNQRLMVRRALLASALRTFLPVPGMDEILAGRVAAGLYVKLAATRNVDVTAEAATLLTQGNTGAASAAGKVVLAASMLARFAGRKVAAVVGAGRGAAEMAREYQAAVLFDHYCARLHVGGALEPARAKIVRKAIDHAVTRASREALTRVFQEGSAVLGRTLLESPKWMANELTALAERFVRSGGNPDAAQAMGETFREGEAAWLDKATAAVDEALTAAGLAQFHRLVAAFEERISPARED